MFETLRRENQFKHPSDNSSEYPDLQNLIRPHLESYNAIFDQGLLMRALSNLDAKIVRDSQGHKLTYWVEDIEVGKPLLSDREKFSSNRFITPVECRERGVSYKSKMIAKIAYRVDDNPVRYETRMIGYLPVMIKLIENREESEELGGYFITNGIERLIRLLIVQRRNHVLALVRSSFQKRGPLYTEFGASIRCARDDQSSQTITLHYLSDGSITVRFHLRKQEYLIPFMLLVKCLSPCSDKEIYEKIIQGNHENTFLTERAEILLRCFQKYNLFTQSDCLKYLGSRFRVAIGSDEAMSDEAVGVDLIRKMLFVHLDNQNDKMNLLIFMAQKLYALVARDITPDNPDSPMHQEILLSGFLFLNYLKEKVEDYLLAIRSALMMEVRRKTSVDFIDDSYFKSILAKVPSDVGKKMEYFLATGNLNTMTGMDLQQVSGYTIVAEKLNFYRYISHFRSVHRGSFFAELKTTTVRKLLPEAWGFLCPVHTPDGSPCGLLNHLAHACEISTDTQFDASKIPVLLCDIGMIPLRNGVSYPKSYITVHLDGRWIGMLDPNLASKVEGMLRKMKRDKKVSEVPQDMEVALIPSTNGGLFPGLYLFTAAARMVRPVHSLKEAMLDRRVEYVGSLEQVYMNIACQPDEIDTSCHTHIEVEPTNMLSVIANLTPFSDFNQSPRNMYQCQMGKQSMGTPSQTYQYRTDNKMYRLHTGQTPVVRPIKAHKRYGFDLFPNGMNAIVAVISYTGYDMEDAMILNKSAFERGFGHGTVYKNEFIEISGEKTKRAAAINQVFGTGGSSNKNLLKFDADGLPAVGTKLCNGDDFYCIYDQVSGTVTVEKYKGIEEAYVDQVRIIGDENGSSLLQKACIKLRIPRNPIIGDKFSSRHGQKGVCSQKWPMVDMPFSESGMTPDVIINPHAFPSRMTIGMFVESMAGKAGALHGICQDATPFKFNEEFTAVDFFGEQLQKAGYNYYGNEPMYSGVSGVELKADIYIGVRTTGPVNNLTMQPIKGRKRAGGIRFGEMERDSLLAHGVSFLLKDRLLNCSDYSQAYICSLCGSILSPYCVPSDSVGGALLTASENIRCKSCDSDRGINVVAIPYVFRYLVTELMAMNIKVNMNL